MSLSSKKNSLDYQSTLEYLYHKLPMFEKVGPQAFKKDLTNIRALCTILGNPQDKFKSIHIAGTNGKGSVSHMLSSIFMEAGYKTGLYISPHYRDYRERIRINGKYISKKYVVDFVARIKPHIDTIKPSFFEITVAMAFEYFAKQKVEIAVIETGLGGRLDSTNIITPLMSIITNIGFDHQNMLGNTLNKIAIEKAGIIKPGIPVLIGEYQPSVYYLFKARAKDRHSPIACASSMGKVMTQATTNRYVYKSKSKKYIKLDMPFHGSYQEKNINTVLQAIYWLTELSKYKISGLSLKNGLKYVDKNAPLIGRWQVLKSNPLTIADGAHNVDGIRKVMEQIKKVPARKIHIVFGTVKDKEVMPVLNLLSGKAEYYFVKADLPRAMDDRLLSQKAAALGLKGLPYGSVKSGLKAALKQAHSKDLILITGSIFVVGEIL